MNEGIPKPSQDFLLALLLKSPNFHQTRKEMQNWFDFQWNHSSYKTKKFQPLFIFNLSLFIYDQVWYYNNHNNQLIQWIKNIFLWLCNLTINAFINFLLHNTSTQTYVSVDTIDLDPLTLIFCLPFVLSYKTDLRRNISDTVGLIFYASIPIEIHQRLLLLTYMHIFSCLIKLVNK